MPNRLRKLKVDFVSLVDRPANQDAMFVLAKRDAPAQTQTPAEEPPTVSHAAAAPVVEKLDVPTGISKAELDAAIAAAVESVTKAHSVQIEKLTVDLESANTRAQTAEAVAKAEQDARETATAISKAEREYPHLPSTTPSEIAPILRKAHVALGDEDYAKLEEVLKAASVAISKGDLFRESGSGHPGTTGASTAMDQIQALAKELREKDPALLPHQSVVKVMEARPDLVKQDRVEKGFHQA